MTARDLIHWLMDCGMWNRLPRDTRVRLLLDTIP